MTNYQISFIIPCYNCANTVSESIESILKLGLKTYEICMVDDGSTDTTYKLLQHYKEK